MSVPHILHPVLVRDLAVAWIKEDTADFDYGGVAVGNAPVRACVLCKTPGVMAGAPFAQAVLNELGCHVEWLAQEGSNITGDRSTVAVVHGPARQVLLAERLVLNCLSRCSGVATTAHRMTRALGEWKGALAATRKTTPGFRMVEKYGVIVGGGDTHRNTLSEMVMLKDNHLALAGSTEEAVRRVKQVSGFARKVEVECSDLKGALRAVRAGCDVVMLDNMGPAEVREVAAAVKRIRPDVLVEASGGIHEGNVREYAGSHVDVISTSALVQGYSTLDFSMDVAKMPGLCPLVSINTGC